MAYNDDDTAKRNRSRSWWQQRTRMERRIIIFLIIALLIILALIIAIAVVASKTTKAKPELGSVCLTPGCVNAAAEILKNMDQSINPCNDFYKFACGNFIKETEIAADQTQVTVFSILGDVVKKQLREMFEEPLKSDEIRPFVLVKKLYSVCMNTTAIDLDGLTTIKQLYKKVGGWPVLESASWNEADFDWRKSMLKFRLHGLIMDGFINIGVAPHPDNSTIRIITLDQAALDMGQENLAGGMSDALVRAYHDFMVDLAVYFGAERNFAEYEVKNMIKLKAEIAKLCLTDEQRNNVVALKNIMTITELQKQFPGVRWLDFINGIIGRSDKNLTAADQVSVPVPQYIGGIINLLNLFPKRDQANYAVFQSAYSLVKYLPDYIRNREQQFTAAVTGTSKRPPRWSECVDVTTQTLNLAVGSMYVRKYFHEEARQNAIEMVKDIRDAFVKMVKKLDWMDETTRKIAIDKALSMAIHIGYPDEFLDDNKLKDYHAALNITSNSYVGIMNEIDIFKMNMGLSELKDVINNTDWRTRAASTDINAAYSPQENSIQFPAAILQKTFFDKDRPQYMNYAAIGYVIGHEITHGFDSKGKHYDKKGNLLNWWAEKTDKAYADKAKCIVDQYSKEIVPEVGLNLNGKSTQGETIADNGGIKEAYLAYDAWVKRKGPAPTLPGLNYTANQMFWISAATSWCSKMRKETLESLIVGDEHPPFPYRVLIPFANTDYFGKDFNCPVGSKMNPKHKCQVW